MKILISLVVILALASCSYRPILDPNEKYLASGKEQADKEVDQCLVEGKEFLKGYKLSRAGKEGLRSGAIGAGVGAASGAIFGNNLRSAARGGLIGLGVGAALGAISVATEDKLHPDQLQQRYVNNCLARKGYGVIGWQ